MSKVDKLIELGASMDWVTPALGLVSGRPVIVVPADDMVLTQEALHGAGVRIHHEQLFDGKYVFHVSEDDMDKAIATLDGQCMAGKVPHPVAGRPRRGRQSVDAARGLARGLDA